jgi:hypothetical protein
MKNSDNTRNGQTILFSVVALMIILFAVLWMADVHHIIFVKDKSQNAGDAAALAGARWQGTTLNLIGELNLMHAAALAVADFEAVDIITNTQKRLCYTGPMTGVAAAQQAAKLNGMFVNDEYTQFVSEHADVIRNNYGAMIGGETALPEPWPGAWVEYAAMMRAIADDGVAAGIDNAFFFDDPGGAHVLLQIEFYDAVAGRDWCWFFRYHPHLLEEYTGYTWWNALPPPNMRASSSSEFLGLWLTPQPRTFSAIAGIDGVQRGAERLSIDLPEIPVDPEINEIESVWFYYMSGHWGRWSDMAPPFPVDGEVKREYDYAGADSVTRVEAEISRFMSDGGGTDAGDIIVWTGAAKPFGYLDSDGGGAENPTRSHLVLPAFREVRLIPIDASSASSAGSFNLRWRRHCIEHLPIYMNQGPGALPACRYCRQLLTWERPEFRASGAGWLSTNSWQCTITPSGGGGSGG